MVAIVSGNTLGLNLTSKGVLGDQGVSGNPTHGQGGEQVYVNAATGNLVMQQLQDELVGAGLDVASVLTYNSLGLATDDNGDNFSLGKVTVQLALTGTVNTAGSTLTRTAFDGSRAVYTWNATANCYQCVNGTGAFDSITYSASASQYTWVDGSTQTKETYDGTTKRLQTRSDANGNTLTFGYDANGQLTSVTDANGEVVTYVYSGNKLMAINAPVTNASTYAVTTQQVVSYDYDASNRLKSVTVDLSPDGSTADGNVYVTSFTYDSTSTRVQTMQQSDGTKLTFTYDASQRVYTITDALNNVTTFNYDTANRKTSVTANGQTTVYAYDATTGLLTSVTAPPVNGVSAVAKYVYNASGQLTSYVDGDNNTTTYGYDAAGNQTSVVDAAGNLTTRTYDAQNRLLIQTRSTLARPALIASAGMSITASGAVKTGSTSAWDAGIRSANAITGAATVSFTADSISTYLMVGLNSDPDTDASYASIDFGLYVDFGTLYLYSNGTQVAALGGYAAGDRLAVSYDGSGHVNVWQNGVSIYTLAATVTQPLYVDSSFYSPGASVSNLLFGAGAMVSSKLVNGSGVTISAGGNLTKSASTSGWDASAYSASGLTGPAIVSFTATSVATDVMVGLNTDPTTDSSYQSLDYAFDLAEGSLQIYVNGNYTATVGTYAQGDNFSVGYDGTGHVNFIRNGKTLYSVAATVTQPLYADSSFYQPGSGVANLSFGNGQSTDQTTRYVYSADGKGNLRFVISPAGDVTEYGYDAAGQVLNETNYPSAVYTTGSTVPTEAQMSTWRAAQDLTKVKRTEYTRNADGQVQTTRIFSATTSAGAAVVDGTTTTTTTVHDKRGDLLKVQTGVPTTTFVVDGLGRITSKTDNLIGTTTTAYADATNHITVNLANGLVRTETLDKAGRVISTVDTLAGVTQDSTTYAYDALGHVLRATDATGVSTWSLYDADGRKDADIDATGAMTEYVYDNASLVTKTVTYATPINTALLVDINGLPTNPAIASVRPAASAADHVRWTVYDADGRVAQSIDATGAVTQYTYDGVGQLTSSCTFATLVSVASLGSSPSLVSVASGAGDRITRNYYDADGHLTGTLDPDRFLTEYQYDAAGQRTVAIRYATASSVTTASTLAQARPAASPSDSRSVTLYDLQGRVTGQVDPTGALTATYYNADGTVDHTTSYVARVTLPVAAGTSIASIVVPTPGADRTTSYTYDTDGRVKTQTDPVGTVTAYTYDTGTSSVISTAVTSALPGGATTQAKYDALGRVIATLDGVGSAAIASGTLSTAAAWAQYGTTYTYDLAGRRASMTDALGNKTLYFYDADGRLRYTVDALNSVKELQYDAFGNVTTTIAYAAPVNAAGIGAGGLVTAGLTAAVNAVAASAKDSRSLSVYDAAGHLTLTVDPTGAATSYTYDALGNVSQKREFANAVTGGHAMQVNYVAGTNSSAALLLGNFNAGVTLTATVRFKATPAANGHVIGGRLYVGDGATSVGVYSPQTPATGAWQTLTVTFTVTSGGDPIYLYLYGNRDGAPQAGDSVQYSDLQVTSPQQGLVAQQFFDSIAQGGGIGQWAVSGSIAQVSTTLADLTGGPHLQALVNSLADAGHDRVTSNVYDADGRMTMTVDPTGAVTSYVYDANGNLTQERQYANRLTWDAATQALGTAGNAMQVNYVAGTNSSAEILLGAFNAGDVVTATVRFKAMPATDGHAIGGRLYLGDSTNAGGAYSPQTPATGQWQTLTVTYTVPAAGTPLYVCVYGNRDGAPKAGDAVQYDDLRVTSPRQGVITQQSFDSIPLGAGVGQWSVSGSIAQVYIAPTDSSMDSPLLPLVASLADPARDRVTRRVYDADGRVILSVDPVGAATQYAYDALGNVTQERQYATPLPAGGALNIANTASGTYASREVGAFKAGDTVTATVEFKGAVGTQASMFLGNAYGTGAYDNSTSSKVMCTGDLQTITLTVTLTQDRSFQVYLYGDTWNSTHIAGAAVQYDNLSVTSAKTGVVLVDAFDNFDAERSAWSTQGSWTNQVQNSLADAGSGAQLLALANAIADPTRDRVTRTAYDADGRVTLVVDPTGAATGYTYDALGNVTQERQYATPLPAGGALNIANTASGNYASREIGAFKAGDTVTATVEFKGAVGTQASMFLGNAYGTGAYDNSTSSKVMCTGDWQTITLTVTLTQDRSFQVYLYGDTWNSTHIAGAAVQYDNLSVTSAKTGVVLVDAFDNFDAERGAWSTQGSWTNQVQNSLADAGSGAQLLALANAVADSTRDRVTRKVYDADGRVTLAVGPTGATTGYTYDAAGRLASTTQFATALPTGATPSPSNVTVDSAHDQTTRYFYDAEGRLTRRVDALGGVQSWTYDTLGNKLNFTDEKNQVWSYAYDADGREVAQISPQVSVTATAVSGSALVDSTTTTAIVTSTSYDAFGNVTQRVVGAGRPDARTTVYSYDADGRQIAVQGTAFSRYDYLGNVGASSAPISRTFYDAFGNAVASVDAMGNVSFAAYDVQGRKTYDVDPLGDVTGYTYDAFGNVLSQTRYAGQTALASGASATAPVAPSSATVASAVAALPRGSDRTTTFAYDSMGRVVARAGTSGYFVEGTTGFAFTFANANATPKTTYQYDTFGNLVVSSQLVNQDQSLYASSYHYFDAAGHEIHAVDAMGYQTDRTFDAFGNVVQTLEYANAKTGSWGAGNLGSSPTASSTDRTISDVYDRLNRKTSETRSVDYSLSDDGTVSGHTLTATWGYDAQGNATRSTDASGASTYREYDALGRLRAVIAPARSSTVDGSALTPVTEYGYDAFGDVTTTSQRYNTATGVGDFTGVWMAGGANGYSVTASASDRITRTQYDAAGHAIRVDDPMKGASTLHTTWKAYDADGRVVYTSHFNAGNDGAQFTVDQGYQYDAAGRMTAARHATGTASTARETSTDYRYNAFGEVVAKGVDGGWQEFFDYDNNGNLWLTNTDSGVVTAYAYDLQGHRTTQYVSQGAGHGNVDLSTATSIQAVAAQAASLRVVSTTYDFTGNALRIDQPSRVSDDGSTVITPSVIQTFDRWGNLLSVTDPRSASWITSFQYNGNNQVTRQTQPAPLTGSASPVTQYFYDRQGHRVATIDADSHLSGQVFDAAGQRIETDAHPDAGTLVKTTNAYDVFGELVQSVAGDGYTATGAAVSNIADYTTSNTYDAMGDLLFVQHGTGSGNVKDNVNGSYTVTAVNERQGYTYDADGHRLSSWDDTSGTAHLATTYAYDAAGHVIQTTLPLISGQSHASTTSYVYDAFGNKASMTDGDGNQATWKVDYFGHVTGHKDLGGYTTGYLYDNAGQLTQQLSSAGQYLDFFYDAAGQNTRIYDHALDETTTYTYDAAGRHLLESTVVAGTSYQANHLAYDNIGRLVDSSDGQTHVSFQYDGVGNRTYIGVHVIESGTLLQTGKTSPPDSTRYFTYDGMNRQLHVNWQSTTLAGQQGHTLTYDADGNRLTDTFTNNLVTVTGTPTTSGTGPDGAPIFTFFSGTVSYSAANLQVEEVYSYDANDRLSTALYSLKNGSTAGWIQIDARSYDTAGRVMTRGADLPGPSSGSNATTLLQWFNSINSGTGLVGLHLDTDRSISFTYDADGQMTSESAGSDNRGEYSVTYAYDAAGNVTGNRLTTTYVETANQSGLGHYSTVVNTMTIKAAEGYETTGESSVQTAWHETESGDTTPVVANTSTSTTYDVNGHVSGDSGTNATYVITNDARGNVLRKTNGFGELRNLVVNGQSLGRYGQDDSVTVSGDVQTLAFDFGFQSMEDSRVQTGTTTTTASQGETLRDVAAAAYGDADLWRRIASANGLSGNERLQQGQRIIIAGNGGELFNAANTFAVNDPSLMIGSTAPRTVVSDAPMTGVEKDNYYKDVYNTRVPQIGGNKDVGDSLWISATNSDMSNMGDMNYDDTPVFGSGESAQETFQLSEHAASNAAGDRAAAANAAGAITQTIKSSNLTADDFVAAGFTMSQMRALNDMGAFGNALGSSVADAASGASGSTAQQDFRSSEIAQQNSDAFDPLTGSSSSPGSGPAGGYDPNQLRRAAYPAGARFFLEPTDRNGDPIPGAAGGGGPMDAASGLGGSNEAAPLSPVAVDAADADTNRERDRLSGAAKQAVAPNPLSFSEATKVRSDILGGYYKGLNDGTLTTADLPGILINSDFQSSEHSYALATQQYPFAVDRGQITFDAEGNDKSNSPYFSRVLSHPDSGSGVTIGRGYDMKLRSLTEVTGDLIAAGVDPVRAAAFAAGATLSGTAADNFVAQNRTALGEITPEQQKALFESSYSTKANYAAGVYGRAVANVQGAPGWDDLNHAIQDVAVDFAFQGTNHDQMIAISRNDVSSLITFISQSPALMGFEPGRHRISYLQHYGQ